METPDHGDGEDEYDKVHEDVEGLVDDEEDAWVDALSGDVVVPVCAEGTTLSCAGEEDAGAPGGYEGVEGEGEGLEFGGCEDAAIEADDGDFDGWTQDEVGELVGEEDLEVLVVGWRREIW